jgi:predicted nucleic acid-binding protein
VIYRYEPTTIAEALREFLIADGVTVEDLDIVIEALGLMRGGAAFVDAYVAALARNNREPVFTFDAGFRRLGVETAS